MQVHWDIQVPVFDFFRSKEMLLRAWDESMNTQVGQKVEVIIGRLQGFRPA